ncbi:MAG: hypothetical protein QCI00_06710, partial [Candidatus Thermoplasmatota archaeon]|nr:hypothetical protein [Candidatus Thermoplasmatota archaeon]
HKVCVGAGICGVEGSINLRGRRGETVSDTFIVKNICTDPGSKLKWSIDSVIDFSISPESGELAKDESIEVTVSFTFQQDSSRFTEDYEIYVLNNLNQNDYEVIPVTVQCSKSTDILTFITEIFLGRYRISFPLLYRLVQEKI